MCNGMTHSSPRAGCREQYLLVVLVVGILLCSFSEVPFTALIITSAFTPILLKARVVLEWGRSGWRVGESGWRVTGAWGGEVAAAEMCFN